MTGFFFQDDYLGKVARLTDQELGRLVRALAKYHATGEEQELAGRESVAYDFIKDDIDRAEKTYSDKCAQNKRNRGTQTNTNGCERPSTTVNDCHRPSTTDDERHQKNNKEKEIIDIKTDAHADDGMPFGLTEEEVQASLKLDQQIEEAAMSAGLQTSESAMVIARRYADEYGIDKLLDAIQITVKSAQKPSWAYVEGVLKGGNGNGRGTANQKHSGNSGGDHGQPRSKYACLFDTPAVPDLQ